MVGNGWRKQMNVTYKKLWKLLIDREMKKKELQDAAKLSTSTMSKLNRGLNIQTDVLARICRVLDCDIGDIVEVLPLTNQ
jgi:DNA-binding Xre family transcriptional regulator